MSFSKNRTRIYTCAKGIVDGIDDENGEGAKSENVLYWEGAGPGLVGLLVANGMDPRTRKGDPRKLKGGTAVLLCLKRQFAGLRYGLYITVRLLRVVGDSSVDSASKPPLADLRGPYGGPSGPERAPYTPTIPSRGEISPLGSHTERTRGLLLPHQLAGKCVSCVARCSFVRTGRFTLAVYSYSNIFLPRARASE